MSKEKYIKLFSCCTITSGASRSLICDLQRKEICFVPNSLFNLFDNACHAFNLSDIEQQLDEGGDIVLNEYISFLEKKELIYRFDNNEELEHFPMLSTDWLFAAHISNCIIDIKDKFDFINESFLQQLEILCCNYVQLRFFETVELSVVQKILDILNPTQIKAMELVIPYIFGEEDFNEKISSFINHNRKVRNITVCGGIENAVLKQEEYFTGSVFLTKENIKSILHCGIIQLEQFAINIPHYTESLHHNTCLNRKIAIDTEGNIKNCPSMKESFGNIKDTTLEEAVNKPGFKKYWNIKKDEITKCKDCEFRHVCTDCRAYLDKPDDIYSAPLKCGYNPYTCEWEEWSTNPLKQKAIDYYGMRDLVKNEK